ncbi:bacteriocin [Parafrankia colletiae]|uniref:Type 1 encapsulin shell protein n=1 Tax=Parafrankia colletiae TaxID=573497 RepID=A0A1S1RHD2_9ACTN|nr:family 1 encapsulin nanocompartment shell protein [Parafrankia colletiae]MCK9902456.1 bacteriocin family protein [Frankia sp. Cpl3]OHV46163.1 bacteriocin [Parafrankia colletiae]
MNHLLRGHAPLTEAGWKAIDDEARGRLTTNLAARKLVDFAGPHGWSYSATPLGRVAPLQSRLGDGVRARLRQVLPVMELRAPFTVDRGELEAIDRGADDIDFSGLEEAARRVAVTENSVVFHGNAEAGIVGIAEASSHPQLELGVDTDSYPRTVAKAVALLHRAGIGGPYGLAVDPDGYTAILEATEHGGYLLISHLKQILDGPVVRAPGIHGAVVLSQRGGDFVFESGQDLSAGYSSHTLDEVELYLEESFTFRVTEPDAAVALVPGADRPASQA